MVPRADVVYVLGDVNRPGGIAMVTNDSHLSAVQAISLAGGTPAECRSFSFSPVTQASRREPRGNSSAIKRDAEG